MDLFKNYYDDFKETHKNELNIFLHLFTIMCGFFGFISLLPYNYIFGIIYLAPLICCVPKQVFNNCFLFVSAFIFMSYVYIIDFYQSISLMCFAFMFQEFSHLLTNEKTMVSNYFCNKDFMKRYLIHTYFLIPLVIKRCLNTSFEKLNFSNNISFAVIEENLNNKIDLLVNYIVKSNPSEEYTTHLWFTDLEYIYKKTFEEISKSPAIFSSLYEIYDKNMYEIENITQMDEIYVSSFHNKYNSDAVFYLDHIDGPFGLLPGVTVNRTIIALTPNEYINTRFPIQNEKFTLNKNESVSFDFNRTIHYIDKNIDVKPPDYRVVLKVHYLIYPKILKYYAKFYCYLTVSYDRIARQLFLYTQNPDTVSSNIVTQIILTVTNKWYFIEQYIGMNNISHMFIIGLLAYIFNNFIIFMMYVYLQIYIK